MNDTSSRLLEETPEQIAGRLMQKAHNQDGLPEIATGLILLTFAIGVPAQLGCLQDIKLRCVGHDVPASDSNLWIAVGDQENPNAVPDREGRIRETEAAQPQAKRQVNRRGGCRCCRGCGFGRGFGIHHRLQTPSLALELDPGGRWDQWRNARVCWRPQHPILYCRWVDGGDRDCSCSPRNLAEYRLDDPLRFHRPLLPFLRQHRIVNPPARARRIGTVRRTDQNLNELCIAHLIARTI